MLSWVPSYLAMTSIPSYFPTRSEMLQLMGFRTTSLLPAIFFPLVLISILFIGPILFAIHTGILPHQIHDKHILIRNLIAAPMTEELCFRSGLVSYLLLQGVSPSTCIFASPLLFGISHIHHVVDLVIHHGWHPADAISTCLFQLGYTTLFGWFAVLLFLRTGHYASIVLVHSFCNYWGLPRFDIMNRHPRKKLFKAVVVGGVVGFIVLLMPLTGPELYGYSAGNSYYNENVGKLRGVYS